MVAGTMLIFSYLPSMRKKFFLPHSLVCVVALLVLLGSLYQFSVKQEFATYWHEQKSMLEQIRNLCPALSDDTFVVILDRSGQPDLSHYEVSAYLIVLYDNLSIMGNTISFLRFHLDGIESTFYNTPADGLRLT